GYNDVPQTWRNWCNIGSVSDFKTVTRARLTDTGSLEEVGSGGEVQYGGAEEEYEQYNIATYAKNFAITRVQIINDDLGALTRQPRNMGILANQKVADLVYTSLLANGNMQDGTALFHADHSNLNAGAALTAATLRAAVTAYYKQTDKAGKPIGIAPKYLVVPPDLMLNAMELIKSPAIILAGSTDTERGAHNVLADLMLEVVSDSRMSNSTFTGYSTTTWYLTADPRVTDTLEVAFLNGKQTPTLERFNPGPDRMGLIHRVYQDAGVKPLDFRTMQKNTA
ncbi:MAG: Clp protease ClpP, partial [Planctomycetes bacterium]|nr:Clp protease ClpP [Planctomycetota bacterium]